MYIENLKKLADQGDAEAQNNLGWCYSKGEGIEKDMKKAIRLWTLAAEQNNNGAMCHLGICYSKGIGVKKNVEEAIRLLELATEYGNPISKFLCNSILTPDINFKELKSLAETASLKLFQGLAQYMLANIYFESDKYKEAIKLYELAVIQLCEIDISDIRSDDYISEETKKFWKILCILNRKNNRLQYLFKILSPLIIKTFLKWLINPVNFILHRCKVYKLFDIERILKFNLFVAIFNLDCLYEYALYCKYDNCILKNKAKAIKLFEFIIKQAVINLGLNLQACKFLNANISTDENIAKINYLYKLSICHGNFENLYDINLIDKKISNIE